MRTGATGARATAVAIMMRFLKLGNAAVVAAQRHLAFAVFFATTKTQRLSAPVAFHSDMPPHDRSSLQESSSAENPSGVPTFAAKARASAYPQNQAHKP